MHQIIEGTLDGKIMLLNEDGAMTRMVLDIDGKPR
jgi:hypothetical protein